MRRRPTDLNVRPVGLVAAREWILAFTVIIIPSAASAVLLCLPHGLPFSVTANETYRLAFAALAMLVAGDRRLSILK